MTSFAETQFNWAQLIVASLVASGVRYFVVSPGSRSTPLVLAISARTDVSTEVIIDERAAGFYALGLAKSSHELVALVCTSGTAVSHYYPAVIEARLTNVPLIVVSADRSRDAHSVDASQTIDQTRIFGEFANAFMETGLAEASELAQRSVVHRICRCVASAISPVSGPVHINAEFRKPLEPPVHIPPFIEPSIPRVSPTKQQPDETVLAAVAELISEAQSGWIVCGPQDGLDPGRIRELARATGFPVIAEATSGARLQLRASEDVRFLDFAEVWLDRLAAIPGAVPDIVLQLGRTPVSSAFERFASAQLHHRHIVFSGHGWHNPMHVAHVVVQGDLNIATQRIAALLTTRPPRNDNSAIIRLDRIARKVVQELAENHANFAEAQVFLEVSEHIPEGSLLCVGNSLAVRDLDLFFPAGKRSVTVMSQRGAAGIDGFASAFFGAARANPLRPALGIVGDVTFMHDLHGLLTAPEESAPRVLLVINNGGGQIFSRLPVAAIASPEVFTKFWLTPTKVSAASAARGLGLKALVATNRASLRSALTEAFSCQGTTVVEAVLETSGGSDFARLMTRFSELELNPI